MQLSVCTNERLFYSLIDKTGNPTKNPCDQVRCMDISPNDSCENVHREICLTLEQMNIWQKNSHHKEIPEQNKSLFR